jgi:hypothetical protein
MSRSAPGSTPSMASGRCMCATATARCCSPTARAAHAWPPGQRPGRVLRTPVLQLFLDPLLPGRPVRRRAFRALPARTVVPARRRRRMARATADARTAALYNPDGRSTPTRWWTSTPATPNAASAPCPTSACATADGLVPGQHHRQPVCQQRHVGRQHRDGGAHPGPVGNPRTPHQVPHHQRRPVPARRAGGRHRPLPAHRRRHPGLREAGFGILVKDASLGGEYPVMNVTLLHPARPGLLLQLRRPPALRDRAGARPDRTAAGPRAGRAGRLSRAGLRPRRDRQRAQHRNPLRRFQRHHQLELPRQRDAGLRIHDWNFSDTTAEDYAWRSSASIATGHDIYIADFQHLGVYACRILVPGMSEIYPLDDLEWENNSVGNAIREAILHLP